jgi:hypothetical protein
MPRLLSFANFILEAIKPRPGVDAGFEELHKVKDMKSGKEYHVGVNIQHHGEGSHKVTATIADSSDPKDTGTVHADKHMKNMSQAARVAVATRVKGSVEQFMNTKSWNSITLGGTPHTKAMYQRVGAAWAAKSNGQITHKFGTGALAAAVVLTKTNATAREMPTPVPHDDNDEMNRYRKDSKYNQSSKSGSSRKDRHDKNAKGNSKSDPFTGKYGLSGHSGPIKKGDDAASAASAMGSAGASAEK